MRQVGDKPASDRIRYPGKDDGDGARGFQCRRDYRICRDKDHIRRESHYFFGHAAHAPLAVTGEAIVEADGATPGPAEILRETRITSGASPTISSVTPRM